MTLSDRIRAALPHMSQADRNTLAQMRDNARPFGGKLTAKQLAYVETILKRSVPQPDLSKIEAMFDKASASLKKPRVHMLCGTEELTLTRALTGEGLHVQRNAGRYVGRLAQGRYQPVRGAPTDTIGALASFAADPLKAVVAFGQATGRCALCSRTLSDPVSVERGVGPVCAERWGL